MSSENKSPVSVAFRRAAARAEALAEEHRVAAEPLRFAAGLYRVQGEVAAAVQALHAALPLSGRLETDAVRLVEVLRAVHRHTAEVAPPTLAAVARERLTEPSEVAQARLGVYWGGARDEREDFLSRAALRPYVEVLVRNQVPVDRPRPERACPHCGGQPWVAVRRSLPNTHGAQRSLLCALCGSEWVVNRILCPSCGEENPNRLPAFNTERYPSARIEACESCHRYVKSVDLTVDGHAIPEVDDLVSVSLDLWAGEQGFVRIESGLAGV
ncbi:MAG: formate dehydrogenase accessory protein FdhE [Myxococcaceae bacterium]